MDTVTLLIIILFSWIFAYLIWNLKFKNRSSRIDLSIPFILLIKTQRFNNFLMNAGKKRTLFFSVVGELSIIYGIALMLYAFYFFLKNLFGFLFPAQIGEGSPVIPLIFGITFTPPLDQLIIILIVIVIVVVTHEMAHGFLASHSNINIKSTGAGLFFVLPLAFVELDDKEVEKANTRNKLRIFCVGSFVNFIEGIIFVFLLLLFPLIISLGYSAGSEGVIIFGINQDSPAEKVGLQIGDAIVAINGTKIRNYFEFSNYLHDKKPGNTLILTIERNLQQINYTVTLAKHPYAERGIIGVSAFDYHRPHFSFLPSILPFYIYLFIGWGIIICLSLAIINMLPIPIFDGDKLVGELLSFIKNKNIKIALHNTIRLLATLILISNIYFSLIRIYL
jgi:membrane-associated protease RseP (regulator of RpoE activity)